MGEKLWKKNNNKKQNQTKQNKTKISETYIDTNTYIYAQIHNTFL